MSIFDIQSQEIILPENTNSPIGAIQHFKELSAGAGSNVFKVNSDGMFLGATKFASAPFRVNYSGALVTNSITINGVDVSNTFGTGGSIITDVINARINTASKYILSDFTFGATDYAGGVKAGDITWNSTTGAVTGGSGIVINRAGIIGAKSGVATFTITTAGDATFAGTLSAASGTLGAITIGSNAWHVDSSGNMWWGSSSTYAGATYKISATGVANLSGIVAASVAAENITGSTITGKTVQSSSGAGRVALSSGNTLDFYNSSNAREGYIYCSGNDLTYVSSDDHFFQGTVKPNANNTYRCGSSGAIWSRVYADVYYGGSTEKDGKTNSGSFLSAIDDEVDGGYVTNVRYKTRTIEFTGGIFTGFGTETGWINA